MTYDRSATNFPSSDLSRRGYRLVDFMSWTLVVVALLLAEQSHALAFGDYCRTKPGVRNRDDFSSVFVSPSTNPTSQTPADRRQNTSAGSYMLTFVPAPDHSLLLAL
jgi:hypothetical protein